MRNHTSSRAVVYGILLASAIWPYGIHAQVRGDLEQLYERVTPSIVYIAGLRAGSSSVGSGVIVHRDGYVVTAAHVIEGAPVIGIEFITGDRTTAVIASLSRSQDLALLKVPELPAGTTVARLGDSKTVNPGQRVFAIGAPRGLKFSLSSGIVSAVRHDTGSPFQIFSPSALIQTDTAINPGNSGGPIFNAEGEIVGIATSIVTGNGSTDFAGVGMAAPSNLVKNRLFDDALPYLGVSLQRIPATLAGTLNWPEEEALLVERVRPGSPAHIAGLRGGHVVARIDDIELIVGGDVIYAVDGIPVSDARSVHQRLHRLSSNDSIRYRLFRTGEFMDLDVEVGTLIAIPDLESDMQPAKEIVVVNDRADELQGR